MQYAPSRSRKVAELVRFEAGHWIKIEEKTVFEDIVFNAQPFSLDTAVECEMKHSKILYFNTGLQAYAHE